MYTAEIADPVFRQAVAAIDEGDEGTLSQLLAGHPDLAWRRLDAPAEGYFRHPFLLWFVAGNPVRMERLPPNIVGVAGLIIKMMKKGEGDWQEQLDYTLGLVATGRVPHESGVQEELIDLLIDAGASPGDGIGALANGNLAAAGQLIRRSGRLRLAAAAGLGLEEETARLLPGAGKGERQLALVVAAFYGRAVLLSRLIGTAGAGGTGTTGGMGGMGTTGIDLDSYPAEDSGFHSHATALHQAVSSGVLAAVKVLVEAGADVGVKDRIYDGTPFDWAEYLLREGDAGERGGDDAAAIIDYLRGVAKSPPKVGF